MISNKMYFSDSPEKQNSNHAWDPAKMLRAAWIHGDLTLQVQMSDKLKETPK